MNESQQKTYEQFKELVNMSVSDMRSWLETSESKSVGIKKGTTRTKITKPEDGESTGHESGRIIVELLQMDQSEYDEHDYAHMRKVIGYIKRHTAQGPSKQNVETSRWRYSLMNWGHDPLK